VEVIPEGWSPVKYTVKGGAMWTIREGEWGDLTLEESQYGCTLRGKVTPDDFEVELDDDELRRLADAIDEYFAARRL
jgi:hypothetical protein